MRKAVRKLFDDRKGAQVERLNEMVEKAKAKGPRPFRPIPNRPLYPPTPPAPIEPPPSTEPLEIELEVPAPLPVSDLEEVEEATEAPPPAPSVDGSVFGDIDEEGPGTPGNGGEPLPPLPAETPIPRLDSDLSPDDRALFVEMLTKHMPVAKRAAQLSKLAGFTDTKRAAVALRAILEINAITGVNEKPTEDTSMFVLPATTMVKVKVEDVKK